MGPRTYLHRRRRLHHNTPVVNRILSSPSHTINPQSSSPLFTLIPPELRDIIFHHALLASPDPQKPYSRHSYWYRPGYTHARSIATNLLRTCRRVYLETHTLPLELNEHIVWGVEKSRVPPGVERKSYLLNNRMKACQKDLITSVHLFTQQSWLEDWGPGQGDQWLAFSQAWPERAPSRLRITIRHTDWWYDYLGENRPLALDPKRKGEARVGEWVAAEEGFERDSWGARFENLKGVRVLELELETVVGKRGELDNNLVMAPSWRFRLGDGKVLVLDEGVTERWEWSGSRHVKGLGMRDVPAGLQWTRKGSRSSKAGGTPRNNSVVGEEELAVEDRLEYYVVLLTYRARSAKEVEEEDAATAKEKEGNEEAMELAIGRSSTNTSATVPTPPPPVIRPRVLYNRLNAPPTYYG
ncbi:hypothetical protein JMJ35_003402 [Cladonia borealis]|uniref:Uncharacterized protein n=1 Tax=Cladonia borealis TaxID=184061 RepID=A0AA39R4I0_9LECA|nr:hypothetical protein JMJ35_003402 [Cladonia borealis]